MRRLIAHLLTEFKPYTDPAQQIDLDIQPVTGLWQRLVLGAFGVLGLLGIPISLLMPILPTTPFVLIALVCFARVSARFRHWLLAIPLCKAALTMLYTRQKQPFIVLRKGLHWLLGQPTIRPKASVSDVYSDTAWQPLTQRFERIS